MKYFFILGSNPTLSSAELAAIFDNTSKLSLIQTNIVILETDQEIMANIIKKIGGTIKFGLIHDEINPGNTNEVLNAIAGFAKPESSEAKFMFGLSSYGKNKTNLKPLAMEFKKLLKESGINSRWVISREPTLSSVVVEQNKLTTDRGVEITIIQFNKKLLLGKTLAVQPFKELSFRDYGRPARDDHSGMLPPKLAQIMINLSGATKASVILDPFCGSGTIITEALLMGYGHIIGADISTKAISDTKTNIAWIEQNFKSRPVNLKLLNSDATQISKHLAPNSVDAIITEPYLGPQRGLFNLEKIIRELERLYSKSLVEFKKILKPNGKIIMIWPSPDLAGLKIINPIPKNLQTNIFIKLTSRQTIIYGREQQKVWREIMVLEK
ncbi:MAG: putative DNA methylase [Parcubacteria group bacterium GW2011_GWC2_42_12]|nr:MAG: putative DNA methylase [Parcubacteria group bacterium GW2011_GWC2_42_12]